MSKIDKKIEVNSFSVNVTCRKTFCLFPRQLKTNGFVKYFFYLVQNPFYKWNIPPSTRKQKTEFPLKYLK